MLAAAPISALTICGLEELGHHSARGVTHVLSILDPGWPEPPSFWTYDRHRRVTLHFNDVIEPRPDMSVPRIEHLQAILDFGSALIEEAASKPAHLLVHCHAGISRSTASVATLLAQTQPLEDEDRIFERVLALRPQAWPNLAMIDIADQLLKRDGRLIAAVGRLYAHQLKKQPENEEMMLRYGRAREIDLAKNARAPSGSH